MMKPTPSKRNSLIASAQPLNEYIKGVQSAPKPKEKETKKPLPFPFNKRFGKTTEAEVMKEIKQWLIHQRFFWRRIDTQGKIFAGRLIQSESVGFPDLLIIKDGVTYFVEVKRFGGYVSNDQMRTLKEAQANGVRAIICCSLAGLRQCLDQIQSVITIDTVQVY